MPPTWDRVSSDQALLKPITFGRADAGLSHDTANEPPPWPLIVVLPLIAGLSLALWAGVWGISRMLGAG